MKHAVSISLGSTTGDFTREVVLAGQKIRLERIGADGDMDRAKALIREHDGQVDAIGLGGIDIYLYVGGKQFVIGDGLRLAHEAKMTPVVDGSGLKNTLEREAVRSLADQGLVSGESRVLLVSAMDRFGMAQTLVELGCPCVFGDIIFNIGLDFPLTTLSEIEELAEKYRSRLMTVPFHQLYPTGKDQDKASEDQRFAKYYVDANIVAGDAHLILRHMPRELAGKGIITNTTRPHTRLRFADAGVSWLATTTPEMDGVSGATNLMEAALVALMEKPADTITDADYTGWLATLEWKPNVLRLN